ncbi:hypothetical protein D9758_007406 [Tetrapyrgos nigripes]|uniref:Glycerophosphocholine acyltransferase 1 n=1 Tax=Tetrapyrgos nigripes TaxID=182062 RepID=A0A8H5G3I8_9AGAR|nr:hypothetical protein D9758_007406 [Tetrapyrgos nigripes]
MAPRKRGSNSNTAKSASTGTVNSTHTSTSTKGTGSGSSGSGSGKKSPFGFERFRRDELIDWSSGFTLLDTLETYFDSQVDLFQRQLKKRGDELRKRGDKLITKMRADNLNIKTLESLKLRDISVKDLSHSMKDFSISSSGDLLAENFDREFKGFKIKVSARMTKLSNSWHSAKVVQTREKVSFFFGVMSVLFSALFFGLAPQWVHIAYTLQALYLLPLRTYIYKKRAWHYFLFDLCYYVTILNFVYLWIFPASPALFVACYCLSHGSLASAVITWRNSLVFHDLDKVTSLFIHVYPPFVFTVIRHFYPNAEERFPALKELPHLNPLHALLISSGIYFSWQLLYWKFVLIDRREKIESGQRTTSFSFLLNNQRGIIGRSLSAVSPQSRIAAFMGGQLVYMVLTELPAVFLLYDSPFWSGVFLLAIFGVSVWNGGGYYIEVFGRKFERELEALRKELAEVTQASEKRVKNIEEKVQEKQNDVGRGGTRSDTTLSETASVVSSGSMPTSGRSSPTWQYQYAFSDDDSSVDDSPILVSNKFLANLPVRDGDGGGDGDGDEEGEFESPRSATGLELSLDGEQGQEAKKER